MVFVKVRETYDLHTIRNKMSLIAIHTPDAQIIKRNYPGLLMQCKAYRPVSCDVRLAAAQVLPADIQSVGLAEGDVAPEDVFNPILYKALSNFGMSILDKYMISGLPADRRSLTFDNDPDFKDDAPSNDSVDQFDMYYGLLSQTHEWKHANPQRGLEMRGLKPLVYETYQTYGDNQVLDVNNGLTPPRVPTLTEDGKFATPVPVQTFRGRSHIMPMLNTTCIQAEVVEGASVPIEGDPGLGFNDQKIVETGVPAPKVFVGAIIVPPSRLHQLFYRLVCEWTLEFSMIRSISEINSWQGLEELGKATHYMSYSFEAKSAPESTTMVDTTEGSGITKVM